MAQFPGTTEVGGYNILAAIPNSGSTIFVRFPSVEPSLSIPRLYGDIIQLLPNYPETSLFAEIYHQRLWLDCVEINIRRDFGTLPTVLAAKWAVQGAPFILYIV